MVFIANRHHIPADLTSARTMELRHLRYFQAVAEELHFSRAARRLRVAQPALSRAIREMEEHLGTPLLERGWRVTRLTPAGQVLLEETGRLLQRFDEAVRRVQRTAAGELGEVRLGYIGPPTRDFLGPLMRDFASRQPRVAVVLEERTPERVWEMVGAGRLDLGLTRPVLAGDSLGLEAVPLRRETIVAALPSGHRLAETSRALPWRSLRGEPLILLARREGVGMHESVLEACHQAAFLPRIARTPSLIDTVLGYVEGGTGIGIVPSSVAACAGSRPLVFRELTPRRHVDLVMVWHPDHLTPAAAAFRDFLREWMPAAGKPGRPPKA